MAADLNGPLGIVAALNWEIDVFASCPVGLERMLFETTGPGPVAAAAGAERAVARGAVCLISWGTAGALQRGQAGEIVLPDRVGRETGQTFATEPKLVDALARAFESVATILRGALVSVPAPVTSVAGKRALADATGAIAVDMESAAIAEVASRSGLPVLVVRVVVDSAEKAVPAAALSGIDGPRTRPGRVLAGLLKSPGATGDLIALGLAARRARRTLRACAPILASILVRQTA